MSESVRRLKANKLIQGKKCGWCRELLEFGEDAAVCQECKLLHHGDCWDDKAGCARPGCVNAPLGATAGMAPPPLAGGGPPKRLMPNKAYCRHCGKIVGKGVAVCPYCQGRLATPRSRRRPARVSKADTPLSGLDWVLCFLCPGIGCIVGIVALCQGQSKRGGIMMGVSIGVAVIVNVLRAAAR